MQVTVNRKFLYQMRPERMILIAVLFWVFCRIFSPVQPKYGLSAIPTLYISACLIAFWVGTLAIRHRPKLENTTVEVSGRFLKKVYNVTFILGAVGVLCKYYDILVLRDATFLFSDDGELEMAEGGNIFSVIAGMLIFFSYIPVTLDQLCPKLHKWKPKALSLALFLATALPAVITGSRFAIILPSVYFIMLMLYRGKISFGMTKRNLAIIALILFFVGYVVGGLFISRMELMGANGTEVSFAGEGYADKVPVSEEYARLMGNNEGNMLYTFLFAYANIVQYELHGVYEFPVVMDAIDAKGDFFYGQATFAVPLRAIHKVVPSDYNFEEDIEKHNPRPGIWSTFFYQWYIDFGWFGIFFMLPMGFTCKKIWRKVYVGEAFLLPLLLYTSMIWLLILNLNSISGSGFYAIFSFTVFYFSVRKAIKRDKVGKKRLAAASNLISHDVSIQPEMA